MAISDKHKFSGSIIYSVINWLVFPHSVGLFIQLITTCPSVSLSVCLPVYLPLFQAVCVSYCLPDYWSVCLSACLLACLPACLPACISPCLHISLIASLSICLPDCPFLSWLCHTLTYLWPVSCVMVNAVPKPVSLLRVQLSPTLHIPFIRARPGETVMINKSTNKNASFHKSS